VFVFVFCVCLFRPKLVWCFLVGIFSVIFLYEVVVWTTASTTDEHNVQAAD
jgi:hypothetical protein